MKKYPFEIEDAKQRMLEYKEPFIYWTKVWIKEMSKFVLNNKKKYFFKFLKWSMPFVLTAIGGWFVLNMTPAKEIVENTKIIYRDKKGHDEFLEKLAYLESKGDYKIVNSYGYMGKYQIGREALIDIGLGGISDKDFLSNPEIQELAMKMLLKRNKQILQSIIGRYTSKKIKGIYITESGILAASHAVGSGSVLKFLESKGVVDPEDGNGVKVSSRIKQFEGFKLELD